MKVHIHNRLALFYPGDFAQTPELAALLEQAGLEFRLVEEGALGLSVAALAGFVDVPEPTRGFDKEPPTESCLVFSGLKEAKLQQVLERLRESDLSVDYKAVVTGENRNWAFGALIEEMRAEKAAQPR